MKITPGKWVLCHRQTRLYIAHDLCDGYTYTRDLQKAAKFWRIEDARETVLQVCKSEKQKSRRALLEILPVSELRTVFKRRYFINRIREETQNGNRAASQDHD